MKPHETSWFISANNWLMPSPVIKIHFAHIFDHVIEDIFEIFKNSKLIFQVFLQLRKQKTRYTLKR